MWLEVDRVYPPPLKSTFKLKRKEPEREVSYGLYSLEEHIWRCKKRRKRRLIHKTRSGSTKKREGGGRERDRKLVGNDDETRKTR